MFPLGPPIGPPIGFIPMPCIILILPPCQGLLIFLNPLGWVNLQVALVHLIPNLQAAADFSFSSATGLALGLAFLPCFPAFSGFSVFSSFSVFFVFLAVFLGAFF